MTTTQIERLVLHDRWDLLDETVELVNATWKRSAQARAHSLKQSCDAFPTVLILSDNGTVVAHCRLMRVVPHHHPSAALVESVVVREDLRGRGLGRQIMEFAEDYLLRRGITHAYLSTTDKEAFYRRLGYGASHPVDGLTAAAAKVSWPPQRTTSTGDAKQQQPTRAAAPAQHTTAAASTQAPAAPSGPPPPAPPPPPPAPAPAPATKTDKEGSAHVAAVWLDKKLA